MSLYHLVSTQYWLQSAIQHQNTHLAFALMLVFLFTLKKNKKLWLLILPLILLALVSTGYIQLLYPELDARQGVAVTTTDVAIGIILIVVVLEASRQAFGLVLPIVAVLFIAYSFLGNHLPPPLWHARFPLDAIIARYNIGLVGMYGSILNVSANYIFLFVLFGGLLGASGATRFFLEVGKIVGRKLAGGPAMTAVVSSALVGTVTGSGAANVAITGVFTIPLMKKVGYKPEQAGGIEAAASTGGAIMPPVMGAVAFLMADFLGIPYAKVALMAAIPAILYYLCVGLYVQLQAMKLKVSPLTEKVEPRLMLIAGPLFFIPLVVLVVFLARGYSAMYCAFWAIVSLIVLSLLRKETRPSLRQWLDGFTQGAKEGAQLGVTSGCVGIIVASMSITGLSTKLPGLVGALSGGNYIVALFLIFIVTYILGCGVPPMATYIMVSVMTIPGLVVMGVNETSAHFFIMYLACFALITPPVAFASLVAAGIAQANFWKTGMEGVKAGLVGFLLPFAVIWVPALLLLPGTPILIAVSQVLGFMIALTALQVAIVGHGLTYVNLWERVLWVVAAVPLFAYTITRSYVPLAVGLAFIILLTLWQLKKSRSTPSAYEASRSQ